MESSTMDTFAAIADERCAVAGMLAHLTVEQQMTPSLCRGWNVHVLLTFLTTRAGLDSLTGDGLPTLRARLV